MYGFRKDHSTSLALVIDLLDNILSAIDRKEHSVGIFLDFLKAFAHSRSGAGCSKPV